MADKVEENGSSGDAVEVEESDDDFIYIGDIKIKTETGKIIILEVEDSDTVGSVKLKIQEEEHIPFGQQELIFNEEVLENKCTLANLHIKNHSILTVTGKSVESMKINVNIFSGKTISLSVYSTYTVADVKNMIEKVEGIFCEKQALIFDDTVLGDSGTLFDYHINKDATLTLMRQSRGFVIDILVLCQEDCITLKVKPSDTIGDIKAKIQDETGIHHDKQELVFNGVVLHNDDTLDDCHIKKESTLTLMLSSTGSMHISIKPTAGKRFKLEVKPSNTIRDVKSMIQDKLGIPRSHQRLTYYKNHLDDSFTLDGCDTDDDELRLHFDD